MKLLPVDELVCMATDGEALFAAGSVHQVGGRPFCSSLAYYQVVMWLSMPMHSRNLGVHQSSTRNG